MEFWAALSLLALFSLPVFNGAAGVQHTDAAQISRVNTQKK
jgi:hypothetical protein